MSKTVKSGKVKSEKEDSKAQKIKRTEDARRKFVCDRCGFEMYEKNCKVICPNCGNRFDCSDLNIYFD